MKRSIVLGCLLSALSAGAVAAPRYLEGIVYVDANRNGRQDAREAGLANVVLSNGRDVVRSDHRGHWRLPVVPGQVVFAVKPAGYAAPLGKDGLPDLWRAWQPQAGPALRYGGLAQTMPSRFDVGFQPEAVDKASAGSTFVVFADPQPKQRVDVGYYRDDVVADVQRWLSSQGSRPQFGTSLGDIVNDDLALYPAMNAVTGTLGLPWLHIPGNHDIDMDAGDDAHALDSYRNVFGPDTFAWQERDFTFIGLDDVIWQGAPSRSYVGGFRPDQLAFLKDFLATLPRDRLLVLGMHIPLFEVAGRDTFREADRQALFDLLAPFTRVLLLTAHNHTQQHVFHTAESGWKGRAPLHEYNVGAACGAFWSGVKDARGIPVSTMADGTPNGWASVQVTGQGGYQLTWHVASAEAAPGLHLAGPAALRQGAYPAWGLYANAYMAAADTQAEMRVDGGPWKAMQRVLRSDPQLAAENARDDAALDLRGYDRSPEAQPVEHLWRGALPTELPAGAHTAEVRVRDVNGDWQVAKHGYVLRVAAP